MSNVKIPDPTSAPEVRAALGDDVAAFRRVRLSIMKRMERNLLRDFYVEGEQAFKNMGIAIPPNLVGFAAAISWPAKAISVVSERLFVDMFIRPDAAEPDPLMLDVFADNLMLSEQNQLHYSALQYGPAFVSVSTGDESIGEPPILLHTYSAKIASGLWDTWTRRLTHALTIDATTPSGIVLELNWWTKENRVHIHRDSPSDRWSADVIPHRMGRCPVVLFPYDPTTSKPFGRSRVTRPVMALTDQAARTSLRAEVSAEFFSSPQRYLLGADEEAFTDDDGKPLPTWESIIGRLLVVSRQWDEEKEEYVAGNPEAGQFPQLSMQPHSEHLRSIAMMFAGASSIPVGYLGIIQDNPSSADALRQLEQPLVSVAEGAQRNFAGPWATVANLCAQAHENSSSPISEYKRITPYWRDASTPTQAATTQAVATLIQTGVLQPDSEVTYRMLRFDEATKQTLRTEAAGRRSASALMALAAAQPEGQAREIVSLRS